MEYAISAKQLDVLETVMAFVKEKLEPISLQVETSGSIPEEIVEEMMQSRVSERSTRVIDHDGDSSMEEKKREGYF